jgi:excisionase family DNA binding protein
MVSTISIVGNTASRGPLLRPAAAAAYLGIGLSTFYLLVNAGKLPRPLKIGTRASGIPQSALDAFITERMDRSSGRVA